MKHPVKSVGERWSHAFDRVTGHVLYKGLRIFFLVAVIVYLFDQIAEIGWSSLWHALPRSVWFYVLGGAIYLILPLSELLIYRVIWGIGLLRDFPVFARKRVYNQALLDYSGEAYFCLWAKRHPGLTDQKIFSSIKDSNILSALVSNTATVVFLALFFITGQLKIFLDSDPGSATYFALTALIGVVMVPLVIHFRRQIIALEAKTLLMVLGIHIIRLLIYMGLQTAQWAVIFPHAPLSTWLSFLTAQLLLTRIPFLPNKELMFLGLSLTLAGLVQAPTAAVDGMFLAAGVLTQGLNLVIFILTSFTSSLPRKVQFRPSG
jgi:hypothetical protein